MDGRVIKGQETKEKIMNAACLLIADEGMTGISAKKIADRAGVSKSNLFHHFISVEYLLESILSGLCEASISELNLEVCDSLTTYFDLLGQGTFKLNGDELALYKTLFAFYHEAVFRDSYREQIIAVKQSMVDYFIESIEQISGKRITRDLAELMTMDLDGMGMHYMVEEDSAKYMALWAIKSAYYISLIQGM